MHCTAVVRIPHPCVFYNFMTGILRAATWAAREGGSKPPTQSLAPGNTPKSTTPTTTGPLPWGSCGHWACLCCSGTSCTGSRSKASTTRSWQTRWTQLGGSVRFFVCLETFGVLVIVKKLTNEPNIFIVLQTSRFAQGKNGGSGPRLVAF